jgi:hypothetical protein
MQIIKLSEQFLKIKLKAQRKAFVDFVVRKTLGKLTLEVNVRKDIEARYVPLTSSGISFYVHVEQTVSFNNLDISP